MSDMLTDVRFWAQVMTDAHRIVFCSPELESRCKGFVSARGLDALIEVRATRFMPDDKIIVVDPGGLEAMTAKAALAPIRFF